MQAEQKETAHQHLEAVQPEPGPGNQHDEDFQHFDEAGQTGLVVLVGELPGGSGKEEKGQDEDACRQIGQQFRLQAGPLHGLEGEQNDQRVLEHIVVKGPQKLGGEEGPEATAFEQGKLGTHWMISVSAICLSRT